MDTVLEEKRNLHEERDRIELAIVNEMLSKKNGHKDKLDSEHRQKALLDRYMKCSKALLHFYEQHAQVPPQERLKQSRSSATAFNEFYTALRKIKDFYTVHSNDQVTTMANEFEEIEAARQIALGIKLNKVKPSASGNTRSTRTATDIDEQDSRLYSDNDNDDEINSEPDDNERARQAELARLSKGLPTTDLVEIVEQQELPVPVESKAEKLVEFTDEEGYGRYLDLNRCHDAFLQVLKKEETKPNYLTFLSKFDQFADIGRERKLTTLYRTYLEEILNYFRDYSKRAKPLFDYQDMESKAHEQFLEQWKGKTIPGWFSEADRNLEDANPMVEIESYKSCDQLMELGLDCLKRELSVRGLKCGGTLEERAKRLWSIRGKAPDEIDASLKASSVVGKKGKKITIDPFYLASIEAKLTMYADYYNDHRQATIENVQRKQARTADERNDSEDDISDVDDDESEQNDVVYNPKNLPIGWDGKPIPYWLYKLHGLNLTYTCEICGNATYKGPKTFQRHFAEWRHAHGMKCLGIPNTAHFANITKIEDVISLWEKLKNEKQKDKFQPLVEEEYEDSQGNVVNKKTYEDLKRQGLL